MTFFDVILAVATVSGVGAGLALLLVFAERYIANYGQCRITINNDKELTVDGGQPLLGALVAEKIFVPSACGGRGTCGLCKLKITEGGGILSPTEEPFLSAEERAADVRLSCQVKIRNDIKIEIPEELFSIQEFTARCVKIEPLTHDIRLFRFELIEPKVMDYVPGQYVQLLTPEYAGNDEVYRAYSIAGDPAGKNVIELIIRLVPSGICTTWCFNVLKEGDEVRMNGPYGEFRISKTDAPMVFVAGGSGMAPVRCMLYHMKNENIARKAVYYFGANVEKELFYYEEMKRFQEQLVDFRFVPVIGRPEGDWQGQKGLVTEAIAREIEDASQMEGYLCGSPGMIDATIKVLGGLGMPESRIYYDKFS